MKIFLQIIIAAVLAAWLSISSLDLIGRFFIKDTVELYGSSIIGSDVRFKDFTISWAERSLSLRNGCFPAEAAPSLFCADTILIQFSQTFMPELKNQSFSPDLWEIDAIYMKDVVLFYNIDSEGSSLNDLKLRVAELSSDAMKDRLNAKSKNTAAPLLMEVKKIQVSGVKVDARSQKNPDRSKIFFINDMVFVDVGVQEGGVTSVEVLDRVTRDIVDKVEIEAEKQGLIEIKPSQTDSRPSRKRSAMRGDEDAESASDKSSPGKTLRTMGTSIKKTSQEVWQKLFH